MIIILLHPVHEGQYSWYECWNMTDNCAVPVVGINMDVIKRRVKELYPNETIEFEIGE